jgi:hypothetical protein
MDLLTNTGIHPVWHSGIPLSSQYLHQRALSTQVASGGNSGCAGLKLCEARWLILAHLAFTSPGVKIVIPDGSITTAVLPQLKSFSAGLDITSSLADDGHAFREVSAISSP